MIDDIAHCLADLEGIVSATVQEIMTGDGPQHAIVIVAAQPVPFDGIALLTLDVNL